MEAVGLPEKQKESPERALQRAWLSKITREEKAHDDIRKRMRDVYKIWRGEEDTDSLVVPLWWSVVEIQHVGVFSSQPVPDCRPRNETQNDAIKLAARVLERALAYCVDDQSFDIAMHAAVDDFLGVGLGLPRLKLHSQIIPTQVEEPVMGQDPYGNPVQVGSNMVEREEIGNQMMRWEHVNFDRFGWEPCKHFHDCDFIYIRHPMTQGECKERFGRRVRGSKRDLDAHGRKDTDWQRHTVDVYEVWCRKKKQVLFIAKGEQEPLEVVDDPLGVDDFYPIPVPMMTNICSNELLPQPDYDFIEPYDAEINRLQSRRMSLLEQLKAVAMHDASMPEIAELFELEDGESKPIDKLLVRLEGGRLENVMLFPPLAEKIQVIAELTQQIQVVRAQVDEILGIADIVRGVTQAAETATAQEIKGRWVGLRLTRKRDLVQYTVREMFRIMAQVLSSHFTDENLARMTQMEIPEQILGLLRDDLLMSFAIDIESDSTVARDEFKERESRQEMLAAVSQFAQGVLPAVQAGFMPAGVSSAIMQAALAPYTKYSRSLDEELTQLQTTTQQLQQMQQQSQQLQQQLQQAQAQVHQWQTVAVQLQNQATAAKSQKEIEDAALKREQQQKVRAETQEIYNDLGRAPEQEDPLDRMQKAADVDKTIADTALSEAKAASERRPDPPRMMQ